MAPDVLLIDFLVGVALGLVFKFKGSVVLIVLYLVFVIFGLIQFPQLTGIWRVDIFIAQALGMFLGAFLRSLLKKKNIQNR